MYIFLTFLGKKKNASHLKKDICRSTFRCNNLQLVYLFQLRNALEYEMFNSILIFQTSLTQYWGLIQYNVYEAHTTKLLLS